MLIKQLRCRYPIKNLIACLLTVLLIAVNFPAIADTEKNSASRPHFTPNEQAWLAAHPDVAIAFFGGLPPYLMVEENDQYTGIIPDYAKLLSEQTGINFHIQYQPTWAKVLDSANNRQADIIGSVLSNKAFTSHYNFTLSTGSSKFYLFGSKFVNKQIDDMSDLSGMQVGYIASSRHIESYAQNNKDIKFVPYQTDDDITTAVANGEIDFFIRTEFSQYLTQRKGIEKHKVFLEIPELENRSYMAVRNDWPELTNIINKVLVLNQSKIQSINHRWLNLPDIIKVTDDGIQLSAEERAWLAKHPVIRVGLDTQWAPIEFLDEKGIPQGISIQYLKRLQEILGITIEYDIDLSWSETWNKLANSELDLLAAVSSTQARREQVNFTLPYLSIPIGIFSMVDRAYLGGLHALKGKRVIVVEGYAIQSWLEENHPELEVTTAPTLETALREVANKNVYALVSNLISTSYYIGQSGLKQIRVVGQASYTNKLSMAVRKDWALFPGILEKAIDVIPQSERTAIYNEWISIQYKHSIDYTLLWYALAGSALILSMIAYWNRRLTKEITRRKKIEQALHISTRIAENEAQRAQQAAKAKSDFLTNMSHEIRTPMNAVIGMGHLLRQTSLNKEQHEYLDKMNYSSDALMEIISDVLDFSKGDAGKLTLDNAAFELDQVLQKIELMLGLRAVEKGLRLSINTGPNVPNQLIGDSEKLSRILCNLISNAIKFTQEGEIEVDIDLIDLTIANTQLRFRVKDTGPGIRPAMQEELFEPFSQGDTSIARQFGGSGLGLAISQQLAKVMGSCIKIDSKHEEGSCFYFIITFDIFEFQTSTKEELIKPIHPDQDSQLIKAVPALSNTKVLLVEDDHLNRLFQEKYLRTFDMQVESAANGRDALQILKNRSFDIVIMDIQMPELDGYETTRMIRNEQKWRDLPIIALTAHGLLGEREKCLAAGMNDYLSKPFRPEQLRDILVKWVTPA